MINRVPLTAAAGWGASLMTRVDAVSEAGSSPWQLAECGRTADHRPSETGHLGNSRFNEVLRLSDVITLHTPLMPSTRNLIGPAEFAAMEKKPLLINTARGGLVDEAALVVALRSGQIAGAGFDVVTTEPPPDDHPLVELLELPNFILTPHVAWASQEAIQGLADQLIDNVEAFWAGAPRNVVQPA